MYENLNPSERTSLGPSEERDMDTITDDEFNMAPDKAPNTFTNLDMFSIMMVGIGCIILVNAVFTDLGFFTDEMPNANLDFLIPLMLNVPQVLGQLIAVKYLSELPMKLTVISMTLFAALVSVLLPIFVRTDINVALTLAAMGYFGIFMAIINSAMVGYISSFQNPKAM